MKIDIQTFQIHLRRDEYLFSGGRSSPKPQTEASLEANDSFAGMSVAWGSE